MPSWPFPGAWPPSYCKPRPRDGTALAFASPGYDLCSNGRHRNAMKRRILLFPADARERIHKEHPQDDTRFELRSGRTPDTEPGNRLAAMRQAARRSAREAPQRRGCLAQAELRHHPPENRKPGLWRRLCPWKNRSHNRLWQQWRSAASQFPANAARIGLGHRPAFLRYRTGGRSRRPVSKAPRVLRIRPPRNR